MARLDNWQNNLSAVIKDKRETPFDFQQWNCLLWAISAIQAVTGNDYGVDIRGKYQNEIGASRLLKTQFQVNSSQEFLQKMLGQELQPIGFAKYGDIVFPNSNDEYLELPMDSELFGIVPGVCYGSISLFLGENGLIELQTLRLGSALWVS